MTKIKSMGDAFVEQGGNYLLQSIVTIYRVQGRDDRIRARTWSLGLFKNNLLLVILPFKIHYEM
jgi:hypothetical protein